MKKILREWHSSGGDVVQGAGHLKLMKDGKVVGVTGGKQVSRRAEKNLRAQIRRALDDERR
jgi:ribosomal protein L24E